MLGLQIGINRSGGALSNLASKAGAVMHLDVSNLVSPTVIRDKQQGNNATLYNFAGTAASGILNTDSRITQLVNKLGAFGNFDTTTGWTGEYATVTASSNNLIVTGSGTNPASRADYNLGFKAKSGDIVYACMTAKVNNSACILLRFILRDGTGGSILVSSSNVTPVANAIYNLSARVQYASASTNNVYILAYNSYADASTQNGKKMNLEKVNYFNLTEIFGAGNEPTQADMDKMMQSYYDTGGAYIGSTPPALTALRPCKKYDGVDDYMKVLTPSAATNITTEEFAIGAIVYLKAYQLGYLICLNTSSSADVQYGLYLTATGFMSFGALGERLSTTSPLALNTWYAVFLHRNTSGNMSIVINGTVNVTGTYASALTSANNLMLGCRSNNAGGTAASVLSNAYVNHEFIAAGSRATIANIKAFQAAQAIKYGITYA